jgi:hypothetical protein
MLLVTKIEITAALLQETDINSIIKDNIQPLLLGNGKNAYLQSAFAEIVNSTAAIELNVRCRNKQRTCVDVPFVGEKCFTAYEDNFTVTFSGVIPNSQECRVANISITTANEIYKVLGGIATLLASSPTISDYLSREICSSIPLAQVGEQAAELFTYDISTCLASLASEVISCKVPVTLTDAGRTLVREETFGILDNLSSIITVSFKKQDLLGRIIRDDSVAFPPQRIDCNLNTNGGPLDISFLVAPSIRFSTEGRAVSASVGLSAIQGIPAFIGNVIARYVNTSSELSNAIVEYVNKIIGD